MLRNKPKTLIDGCIGTQGRVQYFKTFGAVMVVCIEMRLKVGNDDERLKIIAQIIAECVGKPHAALALTFSAPDLDLQAVTTITPPVDFLYLSTASLQMA
jgi:hypothetical protein